MMNFRKFKLFILLILAQCFFSATISAQGNELIKGSEKLLVEYNLDEKTRCFAFNKYLVKTYLKDNIKENTGDGTGYEIDVLKRDAKLPLKKNCETAANASLNIKNEEGNEFGGVVGDFLFVKTNVFPDGADLSIYDLKSNKRIFSTGFSERDDYKLNVSGGRFLNYRKWSEEAGSLKNCPRAAKWRRDGFGISWLQTKRLDLRTLKATSVGALRCVNIQ